MKEFLEGSRTVARTVRLCRPGVIAAYPITPQTHIVEDLAQMVADGELDSQFINVESEHSAASVVLGAVAAGVRAFSATSSQGLLLMAEVIFNIAGMRLPLVIVNANRAVSAPINIWNDHQDSVTVRDAGILQFYAENNQEVADLVLLAYRVGEDPKISLPALVCMDGYILTHGHEVVDIPEQKQVDKFLPEFQPVVKLDPENPETMGYLGTPEIYMETRYALQETMLEALEVITSASQEFERIFGRALPPFYEAYKLEDAERAIVAMGSVAGTIKEVVDEMRQEGQKVGLLKLITYRPFPADALYEALENVPEIAVLEKAISMGAFGPVYTDLKASFQGKEAAPKISGFVIGLGGRDVSKDSIRRVFEELRGPQTPAKFMDVKTELVTA
ncbi:MAG: pyruvate ferredoxin oxidoreductase [Planctomycetes bacterium DG_23]|nr:MAG: pyruvate ferredoxin oxidoreductase [Planctomycetes bacterium DG_23]